MGARENEGVRETKVDLDEKVNVRREEGRRARSSWTSKKQKGNGKPSLPEPSTTNKSEFDNDQHALLNICAVGYKHCLEKCGGCSKCELDVVSISPSSFLLSLSPRRCQIMIPNNCLLLQRNSVIFP